MTGIGETGRNQKNVTNGAIGAAQTPNYMLPA